jgi:hypothetical protein
LTPFKRSHANGILKALKRSDAIKSLELSMVSLESTSLEWRQMSDAESLSESQI